MYTNTNYSYSCINTSQLRTVEMGYEPIATHVSTYLLVAACKPELIRMI